MVVTSGVIPIPPGWTRLPGVKVAVSVDGLPEHHDVRRKPATYDRILRNIEGCKVDISWVVTQVMMERPGYLEEYMAYWSARPELARVGLSIYTPQIGEESAEMLTPEARRELIRQLPELKQQYPALFIKGGVIKALGNPPASPRECTFSRMTVNYSADLETQIQPCVFGGNPDCSQCGCAATALLHYVGGLGFGPFKAVHVMRGSMELGALTNRLRPGSIEVKRWTPTMQAQQGRPGLVQINK
jgi:hypothetical protein